MGLFDKLSNSFHEWVHEDETSIFESPPPDSISIKKNLALDRLIGRKVEGETVAVQKIYKLICDSINGNYFDIDSIRIISGTIARLRYPLEDEVVLDLFKVLDPIYQRNYGSGTESDSEMEHAKEACLTFVKRIDERPNDGLGPYVGKGFSVTGTFKCGTQKDVVEMIESLGCTKVDNSYSTNYSDYIFIGCKPTKRHPSEDFSDLVVELSDNMREFDSFDRVAIAEYDFEPLKNLQPAIASNVLDENSVNKWLKDFQVNHGDGEMVMDANTIRDLAYALHNDIPIGYEGSMRLGSWMLHAAKLLDQE